MNRASVYCQPYTARAIKATGLVDETKALLRAWEPGESAAELRRRAREGSVVQITWACTRMEGVLDVLARSELP